MAGIILLNTSASSLGHRIAVNLRVLIALRIQASRTAVRPSDSIGHNRLMFISFPGLSVLAGDSRNGGGEIETESTEDLQENIKAGLFLLFEHYNNSWMEILV